MFTLLPEEYRRKIVRRYRQRATIVALIYLSIAFAILFFVLLPSLIILKSEEIRLNLSIKSYEQSINTKKDESISDTLSKINSIIILLKNKAISPTNVVEMINEQADNVSIESFALSGFTPQSVSVSITGVAPTRKDLVGFSKKLENVFVGTKIELPVSSLAKDVDIPFSLTITLEIQNEKN